MKNEMSHASINRTFLILSRLVGLASAVAAITLWILLFYWLFIRWPSEDIESVFMVGPLVVGLFKIFLALVVIKASHKIEPRLLLGAFLLSFLLPPTGLYLLGVPKPEFARFIIACDLSYLVAWVLMIYGRRSEAT